MAGERKLLREFRRFFEATAGENADADKEVKINILKPLCPMYSFQTLKDDGFAIGDKLYSKALAAAENPGIFRYERDVGYDIGLGYYGSPPASVPVLARAGWGLRHRRVPPGARRVELSPARSSTGSSTRRAPVELPVGLVSHSTGRFCRSSTESFSFKEN